MKQALYMLFAIAFCIVMLPLLVLMAVAMPAVDAVLKQMAAWKL